MRACNLDSWDVKYNAAVAAPGGRKEAEALRLEREKGPVEALGPEAAEEAAAQGRALLLAWPDYEGKGTFGLDTVRRFSGNVLILQGERCR